MNPEDRLITCERCGRVIKWKESRMLLLTAYGTTYPVRGHELCMMIMEKEANNK